TLVHATARRGFQIALQLSQDARRIRDAPRGLDRALGVARALEDAVKRVEVLRRNRVELVVMTSRACDREAEERLREDVDLVVDEIRLVPPDIDGRVCL